MAKIKVMVVDDQTELAQEIANVLQTDKDLEVVALAADGMDALAKM